MAVALTCARLSCRDLRRFANMPIPPLFVVVEYLDALVDYFTLKV